MAAVSLSVTVASLAAVAGSSGVTLTSVPPTLKGALCAFAQLAARLAFLAGSCGFFAGATAGSASSAPAPSRAISLVEVFEGVIGRWLPFALATSRPSHGVLTNRGHPYSERVFSKILIANRGEIAVRIIRACDELSIVSVAVYSELDRDAPHVARAGEAYLLGPASPAESYLNVERILEVVRESGADAVHPGYGFLAENAAFARACEQAGVVFIGPPADAIDAMGSKTRARELMRDAGVPIVPGTVEPVPDLATARKIVDDEIGYPVAVKAAGGGGGKGFRVALSEDELEAAFEGAAREGEKFFSDATVYLERYLPDPRHVEVQILADAHGATIHLGERDCSIQRRHQKLVEESPAPSWIVDDALRERIGSIAVEAARAVDYRGAGTVEGLLASDSGDYFFLEMNTRVQVEHCVTEMTTGSTSSRRASASQRASRCRSGRTTSCCAGTRSNAASTPRTRRRSSRPRPARSARTSSRRGQACASTRACAPAAWCRRCTTRWSPSSSSGTPTASRRRRGCCARSPSFRSRA